MRVLALTAIVLAGLLLGGATAPPAREGSPARGSRSESNVRAGPQPRPSVTRDEVLDRAGAKVETYLEEFPRLVATESMSQEASAPAGRAVDISQRSWVAELAWLRLDDDDEAIAVRDVVEVDGEAVTGERSKLIDLLHGPTRATWSDALAILTEGARHNLVPGSRNFNLPTVVLFFMHPERRPRFSWKSRFPSRTVAGPDDVFEIEFRERSRPTIIRGAAGEQIYSRGRVWLSADGGLRRTELRLRIESVDYTLETEFGPVGDIGMVVPLVMKERYAAKNGVVTSIARYTDYRRFQTGARLVQ